MNKQQAPLTDKVALVTGGGTGIGRAIAEKFAQAGAKVIVVGRTAETLASVAATTRGEALIADVTDEKDVAQLFATIKARYGRLDVFRQ